MFLKQTMADQLARNPVQYTRLLAFSVNVHKFPSLQRQKKAMGLISRAEAGVTSKKIQACGAKSHPWA